jgi:hypothetical protein
VKWDQIAQAMMKHGCTEKWPKESVQKKWHEMHLEHDDFVDEYESSPKGQSHINDEFGMDDWSDNVSYSHHGLPGSESAPMSAISATTDSVRSRQASDASSHALQRPMIYEQHRQQQQGGWNHNNS